MKVLIQRVTKASVTVDSKIIGEIAQGMCVFLGIHVDDTTADIDYILNKLLSVRLFEDEAGKFVSSIRDINGGILVISQFTLYGTLKKGTKPSFTYAMAPKNAQAIYNEFCRRLENSGLLIQTGKFGAYMEVSLTNSGPATFEIESPRG